MSVTILTNVAGYPAPEFAFSPDTAYPEYGFDVVSPEGEYVGGVIAPGLGISAEALWSRTAKLPKVALVSPKTVIGRDTPSSIQSGLIFGYAGLVDEIVDRMQRELCTTPTVIATGGLASVIAPESRRIQAIKPFLTLEGLELLYRRNRGDFADRDALS